MKFPTYGLHAYCNGDLRRKFLGLAINEADQTDYRAMLAREQYKRFQTGHIGDDFPVIPREFLVKEERMSRPFREHWEEFRPTLRGSYEWLRS